MIDVSVIVPVYNVERYIEESLESIVNQTHKNIEIILVDDGSKDHSGEICDAFAARDARVRVIHKKNAGTGYARNSGMEAATGEYLYFCDPDDILDLNLIEENLRYAKENQADMVVFGYRTIYVDEDNRELRRETDKLPAVSGLYTKKEFQDNFRKCFSGQYTLWTKLFRRSLLEDHAIRSTDQKMGQDVILLLDIFKTPFASVYYNEKAYYNYIIHPNSATSNYNLNRFNCEYNIAKKKEELLESFQYEDRRYQDIISKGYIEAVNMAFGAFSIWDYKPGLTAKEKRDILREIFSRDKMKQAVKDTKMSMYPTKLGKLKLLLIKGKCYRVIVLIGMILRDKYRRF